MPVGLSIFALILVFTILNITNPTLPTVESTTCSINHLQFPQLCPNTQAYSRIVIFNITNPMNLTQVSVLDMVKIIPLKA